MTRVKSLCVYCGSASNASQTHRDAAARLGALLAERGIRLVYGGGHVGLMGLMADAALAAGGQVIGVIPRFLIEAEAGHANLTELLVVDSMHERKQKMFEMADGFVVLAGGLGTLDETIEIITWRQLKLHDKPIVLVDIEGYWAPLRALIEAAIAQGFARPDVWELFTLVGRIEDILPALAATPEMAIRPEPTRI
jgi:uncharacterized protein (TIGR00730 family)